jgi:hypothetical protein
VPRFLIAGFSRFIHNTVGVIIDTVSESPVQVESLAV